MTSTIKVNNIQNQCGQNIINENSNTITLGASGDTIALASGASQSGFGRSGSVNWQTTPKTSTFTAADGEGYFINASSPLTMNLPAGSAGAIVAVSDYARNFATNALTISPNGSEKIGGQAEDALLNVNGQAATFVYVDSTKGWVNVQNAEDTETGNPPYISATGGTITECGNCRVHTFTGPGTFQVQKIATACAPASNIISYLIVGGGASGGGTGSTAHVGGGGGAGGFRELKSPATPYTASPLDGYPTPGNRITVTATSYPIVVGGGGPAGPTGPQQGNDGSVSTFNIITAAGGGGGGSLGPSPGPSSGRGGRDGGSGGGGSSQTAGPGGAGNTPSVTPAQGFAGGAGTDAPPDLRGGGGGGATAVGTAGSPPSNTGVGGAGATTNINFSPVAYAGGGGAGAPNVSPGVGGAAGAGGGGAGRPGPASSCSGTAGSDNTGGGGGGAGGNGANPTNSLGGNGGSGIVIIRYRYQ